MKRLKILFVLLFVTSLVATAVFSRVARGKGHTSDTNLSARRAARMTARALAQPLSVPTPTPTPVDQCESVLDFESDEMPCGLSIGGCEGDDSFASNRFTFDTSETARPAGADVGTQHAAEAPAAFDNQTNDQSFLPQGNMIGKFPSPAPTPGTFEADKFIFGVVDEKDDGLGPTYNAQSCRECHENPVTGGISQSFELRAGHNDANGNFVDAPGGSLIQLRAIDPRAQERLPPLFTAGIVGNGPAIETPGSVESPEPVRTLRSSLNVLGDGFVEALANGTLVAIAHAQPNASGGQVHGIPIAVPVLETGSCTDPNQICVERVGRFGWKDQLATLLSFSSDAYLNEIGITNRLNLVENTSLGRSVAAFDTVADNQLCKPDTPDAGAVCGEDTDDDIVTFTKFMRATKAPPQDVGIQHDQRYAADVAAGRQIFFQMPVPNAPSYSCSICHVPAMLTAPAGTPITGGQFSVPDNLGNKVIRPFGDFLLHDIGTGDGIVQDGGQCTRNLLRTAPLWGVRTRAQLLHDGRALTFNDAILAHQGEAAAVTAAYQQLTATQKKQLITFLETL
jgi:CxxC motif-containing protein (DUF1111 family)